MAIDQSLMNRDPDRPTISSDRLGLLALRISMGIVYTWFGLVKFFPGRSPAEHLVVGTFRALSFGLIGPSVSRPLVATLEVLIGIGLLSGRWMRPTLVLLTLQLIGAMAPLIVLTRDTWSMPFVLTMDGQFIVKDLIVIAAGVVLSGSVQRGRLPNDQRSRA